MVDVYFFDDVMATRVSVLPNGTTTTRGIFHLPEKNEACINAPWP